MTGMGLHALQARCDQWQDPNGTVLVNPLQGGLGLGRTAGDAFVWARRNFDPRGTFIVYGHSAGGFDALLLCQQVSSLGAYL